MKTDFTKEKIDWEVYIERRNSVFYVCIFNLVYGRLLKKITGFGFKYQLYSYQEGVYIFYKSKKEFNAGKKYFLSLIKNDAKTVAYLHKKCTSFLKKEEGLVKLFSRKLSKEYIKKNYQKIIDNLYDIFLYLTTIPMMFLDAADIAGEKDKQSINVKRAAQIFLPFRNRSRSILQPLVLKKIWEAATKICGIKNNYLDFSFLAPEELGECLTQEKYLLSNEVNKRKINCVFYENTSTGDLIFNYDKNFLSKAGININKSLLGKITEVKGTIACRGIARGKACIINKPNEMKKIKGNYIIISVNTTPALMPVLINCSGIVTDEGGLSCHASIISRELKKPCVIGTKIATKVFKNGDLIEIDAKRGIVRKL